MDVSRDTCLPLLGGILIGIVCTIVSIVSPPQDAPPSTLEPATAEAALVEDAPEPGEYEVMQARVEQIEESVKRAEQMAEEFTE